MVVQEVYLELQLSSLKETSNLIKIIFYLPDFSLNIFAFQRLKGKGLYHQFSYFILQALSSHEALILFDETQQILVLFYIQDQISFRDSFPIQSIKLFLHFFKYQDFQAYFHYILDPFLKFLLRRLPSLTDTLVENFHLELKGIDCSLAPCYEMNQVNGTIHSLSWFNTFEPSFQIISTSDPLQFKCERVIFCLFCCQNSDYSMVC